MFEKTCRGAHKPVARTCCCTQLRRHHHLKCHNMWTESADLCQMSPITKDSCTVSRTSICNHLSTALQQWGRVSLKMSTPFYEGPVEYTVQWQSVTAFARKMALKVKRYSPQLQLTLCIDWIWEMRKSLALLRQSRATGMQGMDHCTDGLTARLIYKAAAKAMGVEKTKQQGIRERETHTDSKREQDCC